MFSRAYVGFDGISSCVAWQLLIPYEDMLYNELEISHQRRALMIYEGMQRQHNVTGDNYCRSLYMTPRNNSSGRKR
jgi:hypothetical protein